MARAAGQREKAALDGGRSVGIVTDDMMKEVFARKAMVKKAGNLGALALSLKGRGKGVGKVQGKSSGLAPPGRVGAVAPLAVAPNVSGDKPPRFNDTTWEEPRAVLGLRLIGDTCLPGRWMYPMRDESRRSYAGFLSCPFTDGECAELFARVRAGTQWKQPDGPHGPIPRKTAWMVVSGCTCSYRYGNIEVGAQAFPPWMVELMKKAMPFCGLETQSEWPNSCNLNLYEDGGMSVGWHADDERLFQGKFRDVKIISLSLGARRKFELRLNWPELGERDSYKLALGNGDMLTMEGMTQKHYQHRVPKEAGIAGPRINLTWRWVAKHNPQCPAARQRPG